MGSCRYGSMAEQRFCKPWVGGSTPSTGSRNFFGPREISLGPFFVPESALGDKCMPSELGMWSNRGEDTPGCGVYVDKFWDCSVLSFSLAGCKALRRCLKTEWGCGTAATAADCKSAPSGFLGSSPSIPTIRPCSSVGRALRWLRRGHRFESGRGLHFKRKAPCRCSSAG